MLLETYVLCKYTFLLTKNLSNPNVFPKQSNMAACEEKVMHLRGAASDIKYKHITYIWSGQNISTFLTFFLAERPCIIM